MPYGPPRPAGKRPMPLLDHFRPPLSDDERQTFSDMWTEVKAEFAK